MPCFRQTSLADSPAACSFSTLMICSSVNLLLRMSVSRRNGLYPKPGASKDSRSCYLLARTGSAGPDEVRRPSAPDQGGELWAPDPLRSVRWSSIVSPCRSSRRRRARQTLEPAFSFRVRCPRLGSGLGVDGGAEGLAGGDDRPDDPGEFVGQRHGHDLGRFAGSDRGQPVAQRALALWRRPQDRDGTQHKKPSDIPIALLGYRPEFFLATGRVLLGRHAKPGGEIAAGFEGLRIWRAG